MSLNPNINRIISVSEFKDLLNNKNVEKWSNHFEKPNPQCYIFSNLILSGNIFELPDIENCICVEFNKVQFSNEVINKKKVCTLKFISCKFVEFSFYKSDGLAIDFFDCTIEDDLYFGNSQLNILKIDECRIKNFAAYNFKSDSIQFHKTLNSNLSIEIGFEHDNNNVQEITKLSILDCILEDITCSCPLINFEISEKTKFNSLNIFSKVNSLVIKNVSFQDLIDLHLSEIQSLKIENLKGSGSFILTNEVTPYIAIVKSELKEICFKNITVRDTIYVEEVQLNELAFSNFRNESDNVTFKAISIRKNGKLTFIDSNLSRIRFFQCKFSLCQVVFQNSILIESHIFQTDFPDYSSIYSKNRISSNLIELQFLYGQLQLAYLKIGDAIRADNYHCLEVAMLYKNTRWMDLSTKISLGLNNLSNDHTRSWIRGLGFTFVVGVLFFHLVVICTQEFRLSFNLGLIGPFLKFMNPLRHFDVTDIFKSQATVSGFGYVADFFGRILIAYGYYQTIQAFRRHGKK